MDFLLKPFSPSQISEAIEKAFDRLEKSRYLTTAIPSENTRIDIPITRREAQVLLLLGKGLQQTEVANQLDISLRTVKMYRTFIKNKLNLNSQMALARYCDKHCESIELMSTLNRNVRFSPK
jgi:DNA-binding NarL/FixJ family response regulator